MFLFTWEEGLSDPEPDWTLIEYDRCVYYSRRPRRWQVLGTAHNVRVRNWRPLRWEALKTYVCCQGNASIQTFEKNNQIANELAREDKRAYMLYWNSSRQSCIFRVKKCKDLK